MYEVVSIFSGCGGLDLGFKGAGFDLIYACDSDRAAVDCYARNIDERVFRRDATSDAFHAEIERLRTCDVVLGGFPCQGFSKAGPKATQDKRNQLYMEMLHVVDKLRPSIFIAENVDGLYQNFRGEYVERILHDFKGIGYTVDYQILNAAAYGTPQHRRRIIFVGVAEKSSVPFLWPAPTHSVKPRNGEFKLPSSSQLNLWQDSYDISKGLNPPLTIRDTIYDLVGLNSDIPDHEVRGTWPTEYEAIFRVIQPGQKLCNVRHAKTSVYTWQIPEVFGEVTDREILILETIAKHRRHRRYGNIPNGNPLPKDEIERLADIKNIDEEIESLLAKGYVKIKNGNYDLKGAMFCSGLFKRPLWDKPAPTVLTNFHNPRYFLHPEEDRPFSLRECARLQGFPDSFVFSGPKVSLVSGYRLVGNAVPPPLSRALALSVKQFLAVDCKQDETANIYNKDFKEAMVLAPRLAADLSNAQVFTEDVGWLGEEGLAMS